MFSLSSSQQYLLYRTPTDMRKNFDGLCGIVINHLKKDPRSGQIFIFINKRRDKIKLLVWEHGGFTLYYKRLEQGTFELPVFTEQSRQLSWSELTMIVMGISLQKTKKRKRFLSTLNCG